MKLSEIKPKNLVLGTTIDDFSIATSNVDYSIEDLCSYIINNVECYYWLNIESIWGPLGFTWNVINDYGYFKSNNLNFNIIPSVPDGDRIKRFYNTFRYINKSIYVLKSNWQNITEIRDTFSSPKGSKFSFESDYSIPEINLSSNDDIIVNLLFNLDNTIHKNSDFEVHYSLNNKNIKFYPFKKVNEANYILEENLLDPVKLIDDKNIKIRIFIPNDDNINELSIYIRYTDNNYSYDMYVIDKDTYNIIYNNEKILTIYVYGDENADYEENNIFYIYYNSIKIKDVIYKNIEHIKNNSIKKLYPDYLINNTEWKEVPKELFNKCIYPQSYPILTFNGDEIPISQYLMNLSFDYKLIIPTSICKKYKCISYKYNNIIDTYIYDKKIFNNVIIGGDKIGHIYSNNNNDFIYFLINTNNNIIDLYNDIIYLINEGQKLKGIKSSYYYSYNNAIKNKNPIDIRKKRYIIIENEFNKISLSNSDYRGILLMTGIYNNENQLEEFNIDELCPFDISLLNENNIKNNTINYISLYHKNCPYNITQELVISNTYKTSINTKEYLNEDYFKHLNNCEIKYVYKTCFEVNKDSVLTTSKFLEIINAYVFDNDPESAKDITLTFYTTYFKLIPQEKINQFMADGYTIIEQID